VPTLDKVTVDLTVVLGTTTMPVHQVMRLSRGAIIELDATEADEVKVLANNLPIASGVVLVDRSRIAVEVKQMLPKSPGTRSTVKGYSQTGDLRGRRVLSLHGRFVTSAPLIRPDGCRLHLRARGGIGRRAALRWQ
jgi:flagellar motor switch protein FliN/FliY